MIRFSSLTLARGAKVLLEGADATLNPGDRVGLIGANGSGKSSLFALLREELHADRGDVELPGHWRIAHVAQETPALDRAAVEYIIDGDTKLRQLEAELAATHDGTRMAELHAALGDAGVYTARSRAEALMLGLGFRMEELEQPVASFSGGWRMRLNLAQALMCPSDLLLLDEPTNHLDLETREALAVALAQFEGTLVLVSHDRHLLRATTEQFLIVANGTLQQFDGDLDDYREWLLKRDAAPDPEKKVVRKKPKPGNRRPIEARIKRLEEVMTRLNARKSEIEAKLGDPAVYQDGEAAKALLEDQAYVVRELAQVEAGWLEKQAELERL